MAARSLTQPCHVMCEEPPEEKVNDKTRVEKARLSPEYGAGKQVLHA
jgi:hypothetical protein